MTVEQFRQAKVVALFGALTAFFVAIGVSLALDELGIGTLFSLGIAGALYAVTFTLACQHKVSGIEDVVTADSNHAQGATILQTTTYRRTGDPAIDAYIDTYVSCRQVAGRLLGGALFLVLIIGVIGGLKFIF